METMKEIALLKAERGFLVGRSGSGKSTLAEKLIDQFWQQYRTSRVLIADTKPRFMPEFQLTGLPARSLYRKWDHGAFIPNSMLLTPGMNLSAVWKHCRIAVVQTKSPNEIGYTVACIEEFIESARAGRPQLVYIDEGLDFFLRNGMARGGSDAVLRIARAGRERGIALLFASQRVKGVPLQIVSEMTKLYGFGLDVADDQKRLEDFGYPYRKYPLPDDNYIFRFWDKKHRARPAPLMRLSMRKAA